MAKRVWPLTLQRYCGIVLFALPLGLAGCGRGAEGPPRFDVRGQVRHNGQPVVLGRITFMPDSQKGNRGPVGYAVIRHGKYDTASPGGKGTVSGPLTVVVTGYGEPPAEDVEVQEPLFEDYRTQAEIDPEQKSGTLDIEVPLTAGKK